MKRIPLKRKTPLKAAQTLNKVKGTRSKTKKTYRQLLIEKADTLFSDIVVSQYDWCVTCGSYNRPTCGHVFTRGHYSTRWDLDNAARQCWPCNFKHEFNPYPLIRWYLETKGKTALDELEKRHTTIRKWKNSDLEKLIEDLKILKGGEPNDKEIF